METKTGPQGKEFWDNVRETVSGGLREMRNRGEEFARQGRLHMDIFQEERRLKEVYCTLGELSFDLIKHSQEVAESHPRIKELADRARYYEGEIERLRAEQKKQRDSTTAK
jgi:uncharacterized small protein (DUF1192 family)